MGTDLILREAGEADAGAVAAIYGWHVRQGFGTFEEVAPAAADMAARIAAVRAQGFPWLVAELDGAVAGYGYLSAFRPRSGYRYTAEDTVYVAPGLARRGVGRALLQALIARAEAMGLRQLVAMIGDSGNAASIGLHRACGFHDAGRLATVGFKHGRWVDVVQMQRPLGAGATPPTGTGWA